MVKNVYCYNIKYDNSFSFIDFTHQSMMNGNVGLHTSKDAPKEIEIEVDLDSNYLDMLRETEEKIKNTLERETGLYILGFSFMVRG